MSQNEHAADVAQSAGNETAGQGPPGGLPDAVPDFVSDIHAEISEFVAGGSESLGQAVSDIASNAMAGEVAAALPDVAAVIPF